MPKLRNAETDLGKFTQWIGRKCRNHHPLQELGLAENTRPNQYASKTKGEVFTVAGYDDVLVYKAGGRVFKIHVEEVGEDHVANAELLAVGY